MFREKTCRSSGHGTRIGRSFGRITCLIFAVGLCAWPCYAAESWEWSAEALLRGDRVTGLPAGRDDLERLRAFLWLDVIHPGERWELGATVLGSLDTDSSTNNRLNMDNQESDTLTLDQLYARRLIGQNSALTLGKRYLGFRASPMIWDRDLPLWGGGFRSGRFTDNGELVFSASINRVDHPFDHEVALAALHAGWQGAGGWEAGVAAFLFDDTDSLVSNGLSRSNRLDGNGLLSEFRLFHSGLGYRWAWGAQPARVRIGVVHNISAERDDDSGARIEFIFGDHRQPGTWSMELAAQRVQRDAAVAAFNDDDWWFPTGMRGTRVGLNYGLSERASVQLAWFRERSDDQDEHLQRLLLNLHWLF